MSIFITNKKYNVKVPLFYQLNLHLVRFISLIYGNIRMCRFTSVFIAPSTKIRCSSMLKFKKNLTIAEGCFIDAFSTEGLNLGANVYIGRCTTISCTGHISYVGKGIKIGNGVSLGTHGYFGGAGGVEIGDNTILGNFVSIHPANHIYSNCHKPIVEQGSTYKGIKIGKGCWIGSKATILDGSVIGNNTVVAAGAVVSGIFPDNVVIGGVPAKIIKYIEQ